MDQQARDSHLGAVESQSESENVQCDECFRWNGIHAAYCSAYDPYEETSNEG